MSNEITKPGSTLPPPPIPASAPEATPIGPRTLPASKEPPHDLDHLAHSTHQAKVGAHVTEEMGHALQALQHTREARTAVAVTLEEGGQLARVLGAVGSDVAASASHHELRALQEASTTLESHHAMQRRAAQASRTQSSLARRLNRMAKAGDPAEKIAHLRRQHARATRAAVALNAAARKAAPLAQAARLTVRTVAQATKARAASPSALQRALQTIARTATGAKALELAHRAASTRTATAIATMAHSKPVKIGAQALVVASVAIDGVQAARSNATVAGNAVRVGGQAVVSAATYSPTLFVGTGLVTEAGATALGWGVLPVLAAEAFWWDGPHVTGTLRAGIQTVGVMVDGITGGKDAFDRSIGSLDADMKSGKYGAVIKGANHLGQALADDGAGGVMKDVWTWLSE